ncbi:ABC transporter substrate-binding protein [Enterococcus sp. BWB1-3]|uniref:ABC transporter substrate-binding protein n=1 Tax=Enterococcus sp. BWB1-3 TaxID=2787713 RepID=UPI00192181A1|nr:ABC transporter substrate-binding protein [Enterococcus sp. BWB1-3]MBL1229288.1 ABC transporter substrate-binding protein [Enterococcus sp. BWB1-3]
MKKIFKGFLMTAAFMTLGACSTNKTGEKNSNSSDEIVKINYYGRPDKDNNESKIVDAFEKEYSNIKVNYVELPDSSNDRLKTINTVLQSGDSSIDVFAADVTWPSIFISADWVLPLDEYIAEEESSLYLESSLSPFQVNGNLYGLPFMADTGALYYRKDLLDKYNKKVPSSWDELEKTAIEIVEKEGNPELSGFVSYWMQNESLTSAFLEMYWETGGEVLTKDGKSSLEEQKVRETLTRMKQYITNNQLGTEAMQTFDTAASRKIFSSGNAVFSRDWLSGYSIFLDEAQSEISNNVSITSLPAGGTLGGWGTMVSKYSKNTEAAAIFAKYRANFDSQKLSNEVATIVPTITKMFKDKNVLAITPYLPEVLEPLETSKPRPLTPFYSELSGIIQLETHSVISDMKSVNDGAKQITEQVKALLN